MQHVIAITFRLIMAFAVIAAAVSLDENRCQNDQSGVGIPIESCSYDANHVQTLIDAVTVDAGKSTLEGSCNETRFVDTVTPPGESWQAKRLITFNPSPGLQIRCSGSLQIINRSAGSVTDERQSKTPNGGSDGNTRTETEVEERDRSGADAGSAGLDGFAASSSALASIRADAEQARTPGIARRGRLFDAVRCDRLLDCGERSTFEGRTCRSGGRILQPAESACRDRAIAIQSDPGTADRIRNDANGPRSTYRFDVCSTGRDSGSRSARRTGEANERRSSAGGHC